MKRWSLLLLVSLAAGLLIRLDSRGTDIAALEPVELVYVQQQMGVYIVTTDTGQQGRGTTALSAIENLKETSTAEIFLGTAEHLLLSPSARESASRFAPFLRPDCTVTLALGTPELEMAAAYLDTHEPGVTLNDLRAGERELPLLRTWEGGMILEKQ